MGSKVEPKIVLYTNHGCPWAHRVHIALEELKLPFEEEIIDLSVPRTAEYLKVNPRGLVPSLSYDGVILTESGIVSQFLVDEHPSHLLPESNANGGALRRARVNFFVDTYFSKAQPLYGKTLSAKTEEDANGFATDYVAAVAKEVEPLLGDAAPFFGGSDKLTLAEVLTGSFIVRLFSLSNHGVLPKSLASNLQEKTPAFYKWAQHVTKHPSVLSIYNEETIVERTRARLAKAKAS